MTTLLGVMQLRNKYEKCIQHWHYNKAIMKQINTDRFCLSLITQTKKLSYLFNPSGTTLSAIRDI
jgi:hypothetical protein